MSVTLKMPRHLVTKIQSDLHRAHPFALERVGFVSCGVSIVGSQVEINSMGYHPVLDDHYIDDQTVGAMLGPDAFRVALQYAYNNEASMFHVHRHEHYGRPRFSRTDVREYARFIPNFWNVQPNLPHGAILLSQDSMIARYWDPTDRKAHVLECIKIIELPKSKPGVYA